MNYFFNLCVLKKHSINRREADEFPLNREILRVGMEP
jgi:hypothetical protein